MAIAGHANAAFVAAFIADTEGPLALYGKSDAPSFEFVPMMAGFHSGQ